MNRPVIGLDIGGTNLRMGLVGRDFDASEVAVLPTRNIYETGNTVSALADVIRNYAIRHLSGMLGAIGMGLPSVVNRERTMVYSATNLPGLDGVNIVEELKSRLGVPVVIDHDAYCILAHDIWAGAYPKQGNYIGIYFGTGLGNAIIINGRPYYGRNGTAAELGHMPAAFDETPCSCGNKGCIEMHSCGKAFERLWQNHYNETPIGDVFVRHGGDAALNRFVKAMAVPVSTEVNILDPDAVFVGGGLVHMQGFPRDKFVEAVLANTRKPFPAENLQLVFNQNSPVNGIIGAAQMAYEELDNYR